jgi:hypothetical protein
MEQSPLCQSFIHPSSRAHRPGNPGDEHPGDGHVTAIVGNRLYASSVQFSGRLAPEAPTEDGFEFPQVAEPRVKLPATVDGLPQDAYSKAGCLCGRIARSEQGRESTSLGTQPGRCGYLWLHPTRKERLDSVRPEGDLRRKSSKRVQTGEPFEISRPPAICLISLRTFQAFLLDWPHFRSDPGVDSNSLSGMPTSIVSTPPL